MSLSLIRNFGIKNYRSFNQDGVELQNLAKVNIVIGKNNSGKSNIIRFLNDLSSVKGSWDKFSLEKISAFNSTDDLVSVTLSFTHVELEFPEKFVVYHNASGRSIQIVTKDLIQDPLAVEFVLKTHEIILPTYIENLRQYRIAQLKVLYGGGEVYVFEEAVGRLKSKIWPLINRKLNILGNLIYIPEVRVIDYAPPGNFNFSAINGKNIIFELDRMQHPPPGKDELLQQFEYIQEVVRDLLNAPKLKLEIETNRGGIIITMHGRRLPLSSYGSGIYQLVMLCCGLLLYDDKWICIEEPETNLHPELQRKFLQFLLEHTKNHYLITTHSNVFINYDSSVSIHHVTHNGHYSSLTTVINDQHSYRLLEDLGYRASDLLQSNGIIWVEGPSDRHLINRWIKLVAPRLKEGIHYSIMFYGGKNLANVSFSKNTSIDIDQFTDDLIQLLKINRNSFVVIDSDITSKRKDINSTKKRIQNEIGDSSCWITKGKEIENYIKPVVVGRWLYAKNIYNDLPIELDPKGLFPDELISYSINKKLDYASNKSQFSKEIASYYLDSTDLVHLDLKIQIDNLVNHIKLWNK